MLDTFDVLAVLLGREAYYAMAPEERALIEPALGRLIARLPADRLERAGRLGDPIMLLAGLGLYARRIAATHAALAAPAAVSPPAATNGHGPMPADMGAPAAAPPPPDAAPGIVPDTIRAAFDENV